MDNIKNILQEMGVDTSTIIFGRGCKRRKDPRNRRDRYIKSIQPAEEKIRYVIQYCKDIDQYIVWKRHKDFHIMHFSVIADNVPIIKEGEIKSTQKGKEFVWKEKEDVYTFKEKGIREFAKKYLLST